MRIESGEKVGVVGRSGAGKSTLVNLLMRFYDIQSGKITIDGKNIAEVKQNSLRGKIALVSQDTSLLHRSVSENILFSRPKASEEEMIDAAIKAEAHDFILGLQDTAGRRGYDAHVGERGVTLSGGQKQRAALARGIIRMSPLLILDDCFSAVDTETEEHILTELKLLRAGLTTLMVSNRVSTARHADEILVLDEGKQVAFGTHEVLMTQQGLYRDLANAQQMTEEGPQ